VRREGLSVESVLGVMKAQGARAKLVVIDASRRNPFERRFRAFSMAWRRSMHQQRADPVLGHAGQGRRGFQQPEQRAGRRVAQSLSAKRWGRKLPSTRRALRCPAPRRRAGALRLILLLEDVRFGSATPENAGS